MKAKTVRKNGRLYIEINGKDYPPLAFKSFRPDDGNLSDFEKAGVKLYTVLSSGVCSTIGLPYSLFGESWIGDGIYDFAPIDRQIDFFISHIPDGYFAPMFLIDTRAWYLKTHPEKPNSFTCLSQIAGDPVFRKEADAYLAAVVSHCEEKYGEKIFGYFLLGGMTTEWLSECDYEEATETKTAAYRRYTGDPDAVLPDRAALEKPGEIFLGSDEEAVYRARVFQADLIADMILDCAGTVRAVIGRDKLIGLYYGYLLELGSPRLHNTGHLGLEKVFSSPDIDMVASPSSYAFRTELDPSAYMIPAGTLARRDKLYFLEYDHRTHLIPPRIREKIDCDDPNNQYHSDVFPGYHGKSRSPEETLNIMYRDFLFTEANGLALWWFDMLGGWFDCDETREAIAKMVRLDADFAAHRRESIAEIAVFVDAQSMFRVRKTSDLATKALSDIRGVLASLGAPYDMFLTSDLAALDTAQYRLAVFVDAFDMTDETKALIRSRFADKTVLWMYAPDYASGGRNDVSRIADVTGMRITESAAGHGALCFGEERFAAGCAPHFCVEDPDAAVIGRYEDGAVCAAEKQTDRFLSVYGASYALPLPLLRHAARRAGVFLYSEQKDVYTYVCSAFIGVYNASAADAVIRVREDGRYTDLLTGETLTAENGRLLLPPRTLRDHLLVRAE